MSLRVIGKRADGFHELQSLVAFADSADVLTIARAPAFSLAVEGPFAAELPVSDDNLVLRAARALAARENPGEGASLTLTKNLPVASGIGGGSADAAAALRGLVALWNVQSMPLPRLTELAASLGSDIPVCLPSTAAWMRGRGERVVPVPPLPSLDLVLVNPGLSVSTAEVFRALHLRAAKHFAPEPSAFAGREELVRFLGTAGNDLEGPACSIAPVIAEVLAALRREGAEIARMSGSGATCFGIFGSHAAAQRAAADIARQQPQWWVRTAGFAPAQLTRPQLLS